MVGVPAPTSARFVRFGKMKPSCCRKRGFGCSFAGNRADTLLRLLRERIVILDGAMGTMIQTYRLEEAVIAESGSRIGRAMSKATTICST
jgi:hypothetical protein